VDCRRCGIKVEHVPWAAADRRFTSVLEEMVAYLATATARTVVRDLMGINWRTVGSIVERIVDERLDATRLHGLRDIGIDEFSYRKRHHYLTVVVDHDRGRVIWAGEGRSGDTLRRFFGLIGDEAASRIENVTMDMAAGYISVVRERAPQANIVFDRFHVAQLASNALDEVRRSIVRQLSGESARAVKNTRWALQKNPAKLTPNNTRKLAEIQRLNQPLYRAYLLKESLAGALDYRQPRRARRALDDWLAWASRSRLPPFVRLARTIRKHREDILRYVALRLTNAVVEGINNRIRVIARCAYGFHRPQALICWIYLCCAGIPLNPALPQSYPLQVQ
jgi:transposase